MALNGWVTFTADRNLQRPIADLTVTTTHLGSRHTTAWLAPYTRRSRMPADNNRIDAAPTARAELHVGVGDVVVVLDGELDNRTVLRDALHRPGRYLRSDAEIVLHAYLRWGDGLVEHLDGAFAFAVWDGRTRRLLLARDPLGVKTLHYASLPGGVIFASQIRTLIAHPDLDACVSAEGLNELLSMFPVRTPGHGVLDGVHELPPGHLIWLDDNGAHPRRYWQLHTGEHSEDVDLTAALIRELLTQICDDQLAGHKQVAALLSGGLASSTVTALTAAGHAPLGEALTAVTIGYRTAGNDRSGQLVDAGYAALTAAHLGARHDVLIVDTPELLDVQAATRAALDLPQPSNLTTTHHLLLRQASAHAAVAVSGDGADVVFGGYRWHHDGAALSQPDFPWRPWYGDPIGLLNADTRARLRPGDYRRERFDAATGQVPAIDGKTLHQRRLRRVGYLGVTHYLPMLLRRVDQLAAATGAPLRMPFVHPLLAQCAWNIPRPLQHLLGIPKGLLRHSVADLLPPEVAWQPSRAFPSAHVLHQWRAAQRAELHEILLDRSAPLTTLLDVRRTRSYLEPPRPPATRARHSALAYLIELNSWLATHRVTIR